MIILDDDDQQNEEQAATRLLPIYELVSTRCVGIHEGGRERVDTAGR